jgi:4-amino-4-deoxy-L-arabinose transferase-like glycosyltransferase
MNISVSKYKCHLFYIFAALLEFIILFPISPSFREVPNRDSGVFLYAGQQILNGGLPYISVWDHKGPLIYYINAVGELITSHSWWGVWILEFFFIYLSVIIGFILLKHLFGFFSSLIGSISWLTLLCFTIGGGNFTEEYGILFQFVIIFLFYLAERKKGNFEGEYFFIGVITCLIFLLKPSLVGLSLAILIYLMITIIILKNIESGLEKIKKLLFGFIVVLIPVCVIFLVQGNFFEFIDQYLIYNIIYSSSNFVTKFWAFEYLLSTLAAFNLIFILLISWFLAIVFVFSSQIADIRNKILIISIIDLPIEIILISVPGRNYLHYYMSLLPVIATLICFFIYSITTKCSRKKIDLVGISSYFGKILAFLIIFGLCFTPYIYFLILSQFSGCYNIISNDPIANFQPYNHIYIGFDNSDPKYLSFFGIENPSFRSSQVSRIDNKSSAHMTILFIENNTKKEDLVLIVGAESAINFITERKAPSRYVYQYPLFTEGYDNDEKDSEFLTDISKNAPKLIILTENLVVHFEKFNSILNNYKLVTTVGASKWKIYQKVP